MKRLLWVPVLLTLALSPIQAGGAGYLDALAAYRAGRFSESVAAVLRLEPNEIRSSVRELVALNGRVFRQHDALRAALVLHTHALAANLRPAGAPALTPEIMAAHSNAARTLLDVLRADPVNDDFLRNYFLYHVASAEAAGSLSAAMKWLLEAPPRLHAHAEMQLARGSLDERGSMWKQEDGIDVTLPKAGSSRTPLWREPDLASAEAAYAAALAAMPTMDEARVRLGRVLVLRNRLDSARRTLASIEAGAEPGFFYLARLFEGDALERAGDTAGAARAYAAAVESMPAAQSGRIALAHLRHAAGDRGDAARQVQQLTTTGDAVDASDPWYWYTLGIAWRTSEYWRQLQAAAVLK
jgi:hypothetical protein